MIRSAQLLPQTLSLATLVFFAAADSSPAQSVTRGDSPQISRILFGSCAQQDRPIPILATIVKHKPELFIFMGDNIYADTRNMDVMRRKYETLRKQPGFLQLWRSCPVLATWDDHDYGVNDGGAEYEQKRESERLFLDFWGVPQDAPRRKYPGGYAAQTFGPAGKRVQVLLLRHHGRADGAPSTVRVPTGTEVLHESDSLVVAGSEEALSRLESL